MTEQEKFEAWYKKQHGYTRLYLNNVGDYHHPVDSAWESWQAATAESAKEIEQLRERLRACREYLLYTRSGITHEQALIERRDLLEAARQACKEGE